MQVDDTNVAPILLSQPASATMAIDASMDIDMDIDLTLDQDMDPEIARLHAEAAAFNAVRSRWEARQP